MAHGLDIYDCQIHQILYKFLHKVSAQHQMINNLCKANHPTPPKIKTNNKNETKKTPKKLKTK